MLYGKVSQLWKRQIQKNTVKALTQPPFDQPTGLKWGFIAFLKITEAHDSSTFWVLHCLESVILYPDMLVVFIVLMKMSIKKKVTVAIKTK